MSDSIFRGKILRDTNAGEGIVFVNGEQKAFTLEQNWKSPAPPKVGAQVDVLLDQSGNVVFATIVDETQLAKEQARQALGVVEQYGRMGANELLKKVPVSVLATLFVLLVSWVWLSAINVNISAGYQESATFYQLLKLASSGRDLSSIGNLDYQGAGFLGVLMWLVVAAPLASHFLENKYLPLTYCAPLAFMVGIALHVYLSIGEQIKRAGAMSSVLGGAQARGIAEKMISEMISAALNAMSMGLGFYVSVAVALWLSLIGVKKFLANQ